MMIARQTATVCAITGYCAFLKMPGSAEFSRTKPPAIRTASMVIRYLPRSIPPTKRHKRTERRSDHGAQDRHAPLEAWMSFIVPGRMKNTVDMKESRSMGTCLLFSLSEAKSSHDRGCSAHALLLCRQILQAPLFSIPESFRIDSYFFAVFATVASASPKSAALLNSMISQATWAFLSIIMV